MKLNKCNFIIPWHSERDNYKQTFIFTCKNTYYPGYSLDIYGCSPHNLKNIKERKNANGFSLFNLEVWPLKK